MSRAATDPAVRELVEVLRRRVTWLRTTTERLPGTVRVGLANEIEVLLDQLEHEEQVVELVPGRVVADGDDSPVSIEREVVDLVGALRDSVEAAKRRREERHAARTAHDDGTRPYRPDASTTGIG